MKKNIVLPVVLGLGMAVCVVAQSESDFSGWMKDVAATKGKAKKAMDAKDNTEVATDASHLEMLFSNVAAYFSSHNMSDAADMAKKQVGNAKDLASAAQAGDDAKMQSSMGAVNGMCGQCHMAHREGTPGNFKIK
ncbi:MAG: cytochrome c [Acidobacteriia bacterium]|nr:cytochrome c [Terriglobia bacterium]